MCTRLPRTRPARSGCTPRTTTASTVPMTAATVVSIADGLPADFGFPIVVHPHAGDRLRLPAGGRRGADPARRVRPGSGARPTPGRPGRLDRGLPDGFFAAVMRDAMTADNARADRPLLRRPGRLDLRQHRRRRVLVGDRRSSARRAVRPGRGDLTDQGRAGCRSRAQQRFVTTVPAGSACGDHRRHLAGPSCSSELRRAARSGSVAVPRGPFGERGADAGVPAFTDGTSSTCSWPTAPPRSRCGWGPSGCCSSTTPRQAWELLTTHARRTGKGRGLVRARAAARRRPAHQ